MIGQCLLNKNESATVSKSKKKLDLNKTYVLPHQFPFLFQPRERLSFQRNQHHHPTLVFTSRYNSCDLCPLPSISISPTSQRNEFFRETNITILLVHRLVTPLQLRVHALVKLQWVNSKRLLVSIESHLCSCFLVS